MLSQIRHSDSGRSPVLSLSDKIDANGIVFLWTRKFRLAVIRKATKVTEMVIFKNEVEVFTPRYLNISGAAVSSTHQQSAYYARISA